MVGAPSFLEVTPTSTRALPEGYKSYFSFSPATAPANATIEILLATATTCDTDHPFSVKLDPVTSYSTWKSEINVEVGQSYYIYGFMPQVDAGGATVEMLTTTNSSVTTNSTSFADGCRLTIKNLKTLTSSDVCALVGVGESDDPYTLQDNTKLGQFHYTQGNMYLFLLLKHLYAGLHFKAHIDTEYAKLRVIKVKKMTLKTANQISDKIDVGITIIANEDGDDPITGDIAYNDAEGSTTSYATLDLYNDADNPFTLPTQTTTEFLSCFAPGKCTSFELTSTYDVYDKKGNLIRQDCKAVNKIETNSIMDITSMEAGDIYTIDLKVQPTYLYVLSDPDLDNPTFTVVTGN